MLLGGSNRFKSLPFVLGVNSAAGQHQSCRPHFSLGGAKPDLLAVASVQFIGDPPFPKVGLNHFVFILHWLGCWSDVRFSGDRPRQRDR